jgi:hypothetical protein
MCGGCQTTAAHDRAEYGLQVVAAGVEGIVSVSEV